MTVEELRKRIADLQDLYGILNTEDKREKVRKQIYSLQDMLEEKLIERSKAV